MKELVLYVLLQLSDLVTTLLAAVKGAVELNFLMNNIYFPLIKVVVIMVSTSFLFYLYKTYYEKVGLTRAVTWCLCLFYFGIVINNLRWII